MSDHHDRGAYTPQSDAPLAFDARSSRRGGGGQPMPVTLIISGVILIILVAAMAVFFVHNAHDTGTAPSAGQSIDAIKSPPGVPEAKPAEQSGVQIGYTQGNPPIPTDANTAAASAASAPTFTAPPEAPGVRPAPAATPAPAKPQTIDAILKEAPAKPAPKTSDEIIAEAAAKPVQTVVKPQPAPKAEASATAKSAATAASKSAGPMVQIGAFSSDALAEKSMSDVSIKIPAKAAGKTLKIEKAEVGGKTLSRALVAGFASRADADSFCAALKAQGGACSVRD